MITIGLLTFLLPLLHLGASLAATVPRHGTLCVWHFLFARKQGVRLTCRSPRQAPPPETNPTPQPAVEGYTIDPGVFNLSPDFEITDVPVRCVLQFQRGLADSTVDREGILVRYQVSPLPTLDGILHWLTWSALFKEVCALLSALPPRTARYLSDKG